MLTTRARWFPLILFLVSLTTPALAGPPKVPDDFEVRLVAYVPAIHFPSQVATEPGGGLFIAEDPMDQEGPYESKHGKILLLRDGKPPQVFADGFRAIFGMTWHDGSLYVSHMPYLTVLRDADGDGVAESRKDLFTDLGIVDNKGLNDHIVSGVQFGIDGKLYIAVGDKGVLKATGPDGKTAQIKGGGTLRCRADGTGIEVLTTGTRNHLEPNLDAQDNLFTYDNTDDGDGWWTRVTHHVDGGYYGYPYDYHSQPDRFLNRISEYGGGSPTGGLVYREDAWPEQYRGRVLWAEWGKRKVQAFRFKPSGASFEVENVLDLAEAGQATNFHPIDLALSYDGKTLYVADWGMGGWGSKTEKVGTVFAITYKGPEIKTRPRGTDADPLQAQFRQLDHPSYNERMRAQAAIIRAGKAGWTQAMTMLVDETVDPVARRHLVWIVDALGGDGPEADALMIGLISKVDDVRAQTARALGERRRDSAADTMVAALGDASPAVRLQAIIALGRIGAARTAPALVPLLVDPDRTLAFSARQALRRINAWDALAPTLKSADTKLRAATLAALELVAEPGAVAALRGLLDDHNAPVAERARALTELALVVRKAPPWDGKWWGTRPTQGKPPARTVDWAATPAIVRTIEASLTDSAAPVRLASIAAVVETRDAQAIPTLRARFAPGVEPVADVRSQVALTLGTLADNESIPALVAAINDDATPEPVRVAALGGLGLIGGAQAVQPLVNLLRTRGDSFPEPSLVRVIQTLGRFGAKDSIPELLARLASPATAVRVAALEALGAIGVAPSLLPSVRGRLNDPQVEVRKAALATLGRLKDHDAVPGMLPFTIDDATRFEATLALAQVPDIRALQVYLQGLTDKSQEVRRASARAFIAIRDEAAPALERIAARHELSPSALPELRRIYNQFQPVRTWNLMGPLALGAEPPMPPGDPVDPAATVSGPEGVVVGWKIVQGDVEHGAVDLLKRFAPEINKKSAFAAAEITSEAARPARMMVGCDDTLQVWLNGAPVKTIDGNHSYAADMAEFGVRLQAGKNRLLIKSGNDGGDWKFSAAVTQPGDYAFLKGPSDGGYNPDKHRAVAQAGGGNPTHGKALFSDLKGLACVKCHVADQPGGAIGPNLAGIATMYPRAELITSVLAPSARIFSGYEAVTVATNDGRVLTGIVKSDNASGLEIEDADGKRVKLAPAAVEERKTSDVSLMPSGIVEGVSPQDFADLIAYLETLKDAAANQGTPAAK